MDRLGNLTIAPKGWNKNMGNKMFKEKLEKYKGSSLRIQRELASYDNWGFDKIDKREEEIVNFALKRWMAQ